MPSHPLIGRRFYRSSLWQGAAIVTVLDANRFRIQALTPTHAATDHISLYILLTGEKRWSMSLAEVHTDANGVPVEERALLSLEGDDEGFDTEGQVCIRFDGAQKPIGWIELV